VPRQNIAGSMGAHTEGALSWGRFVYFEDPDGNSWALQELPKRPDRRVVNQKKRPRPKTRAFLIENVTSW